MTQFTELFDEYMKIASLSDEALAGQVGVTKVAVHHWRTGKIKKSPSREKVFKCAEALELTPKQRMEFFRVAGILLETPKFIPVVGNPVMKPYQFFGREKLLGQVYWAWKKVVPESIVIIGPPRSGKTSILNYLKNINHAEYYRPDQPKGWPDNWLPYHVQTAFVDFQDANMFQPETLMVDILQQLNLEAPSDCDLAKFSSLLKNALTKYVVILMDNIEIGLKMVALNEPFWWNMAALGRSERVSFVVTASESPLRLARDSGKPSPFFKLFAQILELGAFTEKEARELLDNSPQPFSSEEIESMLKDSEYWPSSLQKLCDMRLRDMRLQELLGT
jgi:transcriptional regulator with XRE-family HTH domain